MARAGYGEVPLHQLLLEAARQKRKTWPPTKHRYIWAIMQLAGLGFEAADARAFVDSDDFRVAMRAYEEFNATPSITRAERARVLDLLEVERGQVDFDKVYAALRKLDSKLLYRYKSADAAAAAGERLEALLLQHEAALIDMDEALGGGGDEEGVMAVGAALVVRHYPGAGSRVFNRRGALFDETPAWWKGAVLLSSVAVRAAAGNPSDGYWGGYVCRRAANFFAATLTTKAPARPLTFEARAVARLALDADCPYGAAALLQYVAPAAPAIPGASALVFTLVAAGAPRIGVKYWNAAADVARAYDITALLQRTDKPTSQRYRGRYLYYRTSRLPANCALSFEARCVAVAALDARGRGEAVQRALRRLAAPAVPVKLSERLVLAALVAAGAPRGKPTRWEVIHQALTQHVSLLSRLKPVTLSIYAQDLPAVPLSFEARCVARVALDAGKRAGGLGAEGVLRAVRLPPPPPPSVPGESVEKLVLAALLAAGVPRGNPVLHAGMRQPRPIERQWQRVVDIARDHNVAPLSNLSALALSSRSGMLPDAPLTFEARCVAKLAVVAQSGSGAAAALAALTL